MGEDSRRGKMYVTQWGIRCYDCPADIVISGASQHNALNTAFNRLGWASVPEEGVLQNAGHVYVCHKCALARERKGDELRDFMPDSDMEDWVGLD
jgi:hypothetical protein